jgi:hypothetical protein
MGKDCRPVRRSQLDLASDQSLLVPDIAITRDRDIEACFFSNADQFAIFDGRPSHATGSMNLITGEGATKSERGYSGRV